MMFFTKVYSWIKHESALRRNFSHAKRSLLFSPDLTDEEKNILKDESVKFVEVLAVASE